MPEVKKKPTATKQAKIPLDPKLKSPRETAVNGTKSNTKPKAINEARVEQKRALIDKRRKARNLPPIDWSKE